MTYPTNPYRVLPVSANPAETKPTTTPGIPSHSFFKKRPNVVPEVATTPEKPGFFIQDLPDFVPKVATIPDQEKTVIYTLCFGFEGDSLSDGGIEYITRIIKVLPFTFGQVLPESKTKEFTNGHVWVDLLDPILSLYLKMQYQLFPMQSHSHDENEKFLNLAQGGATAYNYSSLHNLFKNIAKLHGFVKVWKYIKNFLISCFLSNIEEQSNHFNALENIPDRPVCIFAGANDLITLDAADEDGVSRALEGILNAIEKTLNTKNILVNTLPDPSKTPCYENKSVAKKVKIHRLAVLLNDGLKKLAQSFRFIDFSAADIYQIENENEKDEVLAKIKREGILFVGTGSKRKVYFVEKGSFVKDISANDENIQHERCIPIELTDEEQEMLGSVKLNRKVEKNKGNARYLNNLVSKLAGKARLNKKVDLFDAYAFFNELYENPEENGFTRGCAVYHNFNNDFDKCASNIKGNAIVLNKINGNKIEVLCYLQGKLLKDKESDKDNESDHEAIKIELKLAPEDIKELNLRVEKLSSGNCQLIDAEQKHDALYIRIIQQGVKRIADQYGKKITLANHRDLFWVDGKHPSAGAHLLFGYAYANYIKGIYSYAPPLRSNDDLGVLQRIREAKNREAPPLFPSHEAPGCF